MEKATQLNEKLPNQSKKNPTVISPKPNFAANSVPTSPSETKIELHNLHGNNSEVQRDIQTQKSLIPDPSTSLISVLKNKTNQSKKASQPKKKQTKKGIC